MQLRMPHEPTPIFDTLPFVEIGLTPSMAEGLASLAITRCLDAEPKPIIPASRFINTAFPVFRVERSSVALFYHALTQDERLHELPTAESPRDIDMQVIGRANMQIDMIEIESIVSGVVAYFLEHVTPDSRVGRGGIIKIVRTLGHFLTNAEVEVLFEMLRLEPAIMLLENGGYTLADRIDT